MQSQFSRTELLLGKEGVEKLKNSTVAVFGLGGVGGHAAEALCRCGVGRLVLVDSDEVSLTNLNRQLLATLSTVGRKKTEVARERFLDINPDCDIQVYTVFFGPDTVSLFDFPSYDYVVDAIDTVTGKLSLIEEAKKAGVPVISSMGAGNKLDPSAFEVTDISKTSVCPLARVMRRELKKRGISEVKVVYSKEEPRTPVGNTEELPPGRRSIPGSISFVPSVAGLLLAGEVVRDISGV